jgi:hypothetical protein
MCTRRTVSEGGPYKGRRGLDLGVDNGNCHLGEVGGGWIGAGWGGGLGCYSQEGGARVENPFPGLP